MFTHFRHNPPYYWSSSDNLWYLQKASYSCGDVKVTVEIHTSSRIAQTWLANVFARYASQNLLQFDAFKRNLIPAAGYSFSSLIWWRRMFWRPSNFSTRAIKVSLKFGLVVMCQTCQYLKNHSGCSSLYSERSAIKPGTASANSISFLPQAARNVFYFRKPQRHSFIYSIFVIVNFMQNYVISLEIY
jgi:hypothetical protein